jgi:hypothetical protein
VLYDACSESHCCAYLMSFQMAVFIILMLIVVCAVCGESKPISSAYDLVPDRLRHVPWHDDLELGTLYGIRPLYSLKNWFGKSKYLLRKRAGKFASSPALTRGSVRSPDHAEVNLYQDVGERLQTPVYTTERTPVYNTCKRCISKIDSHSRIMLDAV